MKNTDPKQRKAWEKSPREHIRAYAAAKEYFDLGAERSLDKVAHRLQKSLGLMKRWSTRNHWGQRAAAYDRWCNRIKQQELEDQRRQTAQRWAAREEKRREDDYQLSVKMREKALDILKYPVATITTSSADGKSTTTVKPGRWSLATVARLAEAASNLSGKAIRNDGACQNVIEEVDVFDLVPYKSQRGRGKKNQ
jgi:hypothetical protein